MIQPDFCITESHHLVSSPRPDSKDLWERVLTSFGKNSEVPMSPQTLELGTAFAQALYRDLSEGENRPLRLEEVTVLSRIVLEYQEKVEKMRQNEDLKEWVRDGFRDAGKTIDLLSLFQICLRTNPTVLLECSIVLQVAKNALEAVSNLVSVLPELHRDYPQVLEILVQVLICVQSYLQLLAQTGILHPLDDFSNAFIRLNQEFDENEELRRIANEWNPTFSKSDKETGPCALIESAGLTLRLIILNALHIQLIAQPNEYIRIHLEEQLSGELLVFTCPSTVLNYILLRLHMQFPLPTLSSKSDSPRSTTPLLCRNFIALYQELQRREGDVDPIKTRLPHWVSIPELTGFIEYITNLLSENLDGCLLRAFVDFLVLDELKPIQSFAYQSIAQICTRTNFDRFQAAKVHVCELLIEQGTIPDPAIDAVGKLCRCAMYPEELAAIIQRVHKALRWVNSAHVEVPLMAVVLDAVLHIQNPTQDIRTPDRTTFPQWTLAGNEFFSSVLDAITSLGGLSIFLPLFDLVPSNVDVNQLRNVTLQIFQAANGLVSVDFLDFLGLRLEETSEICDFAEDTVIWILSLYSECLPSQDNDSDQLRLTSLAQKRQNSAGQNLLLNSRMYFRLPDEQYFSYIYPAALSLLTDWARLTEVLKTIDYKDRTYEKMVFCAAETLYDEIWNRNEFSQRGKTLEGLEEIIVPLVSSLQSEHAVCEFLAYSLRSLPDHKKSESIFKMTLRMIESGIYLVDLERYNEAIVIFKEFTNRLDINLEMSGLASVLVQILVILHRNGASRISFNGVTQRPFFTKPREEYLKIPGRIIKELDFQTYKVLVYMICEVPRQGSEKVKILGFRDLLKNPKLRWEDRADKGLEVLTSLLTRINTESVFEIWDDFGCLLEVDPGKLAQLSSFPTWVTHFLDRLLMVVSDRSFWKGFWQKITPLFLAKSPMGENMGGIRLFLYEFLKPGRDDFRKHLTLFLEQIHFSSNPDSAMLVLYRDILLAIEEAVLERGSLMSLDWFAIVKTLPYAYISMPKLYQKSNPLPLLPYDKVFHSHEITLPTTDRVSFGGSKRVLVNLSVFALRESRGICEFEQLGEVLRDVLKGSANDCDKGTEDVFERKGFMEALVLVEVTLLVLETTDFERKIGLVSILIRLWKELNFTKKIKHCFPESEESFKIYRNLLLQHGTDALEKKSVFPPLDSVGFARFCEIGEEENKEMTWSVRCRRMEELLEVQGDIEDPEQMLGFLMNLEWQKVVYLYLLINTKFRLTIVEKQALNFKKSLKYHLSSDEKSDVLSMSRSKVWAKIQTRDKSLRYQKMYVKYQWKAWTKVFSGPYGLWRISEDSKYWKVANFLDGLGQRTRIKVAKHGSDHQEAVHRRQRISIDDPKATILRLESPDVPGSPYDLNSSRPSIDGFTSDLSDLPTDEERKTGDFRKEETDLEFDLAVACERIMCKGTVVGKLDVTTDFLVFSSTARRENSDWSTFSSLVTFT